MIVGVDFDRVLFDTDAFVRELNQSIDGFHHTEEEPYDENGNYSPEKHAEILDIPVERIYQGVKETASGHLYSDVEELEDVPAEVVIVTRGREKFQKLKIENSGILEYVDNYVIMEEDSKQVAGIELLVDDLEKELEKVSVPTFQFDREKHGIEDIVEKVKELEA